MLTSSLSQKMKDLEPSIRCRLSLQELNGCCGELSKIYKLMF